MKRFLLWFMSGCFVIFYWALVSFQEALHKVGYGSQEAFVYCLISMGSWAIGMATGIWILVKMPARRSGG